MKKIVMKFGGTSIGTGENIRHVAELVTQYAKNDCRVAVVVSALAGVTNSLIEIACQAKKSDEKRIQTFTAELLKKHTEAISTAITSKQIQK
ncbi:MAG: aspartate kinase, partial [Candidatus Bathyarchaeota archaeon]|nr:aspartate kinase [Candidatus Bathyarchaeota archaeon]